ncbi:IS200/IS605 family element transposase accessory protein TnpB [Candidatus Uhrbacteria bacterium]|nr:IS200/IS605 family element transposase accessory protein TnpB [Candidatus Uhrbacteria bacterium]
MEAFGPMNDIILKAYKTELDPNNVQRSIFKRYAWVSAAVYNTMLREWEHVYDITGKSGSIYEIRKRFNAVKDDICPWARTAPYGVTESAALNLGRAIDNFFRQRKDGTVDKRVAKMKANGTWARHYAKCSERGKAGIRALPGYPKEKRYLDSFQFRGLKVRGNEIYIARTGWIRLKEHNYIPLSTSGLKFATYATVKLHAGRWFISAQVYEPRPQINDHHDLVVGVDFGIKDLAICSTGKVFENPHPLREAQKKLRRLQRELSRRKKGGQNWKKTRAKLQKQHRRVANIRRYTLHEISSYLTKEVRPSIIVLEDLNVEGMKSNHCLAQAISDAGFAELRRQIEYKADWYGSYVLLADRWEPSSKRCSGCGYKRENLSLADRTFNCPSCGLIIDRDLNAAYNLRNIGERFLGIHNEPLNERGLPRELGRSNASL